MFSEINMIKFDKNGFALESGLIIVSVTDVDNVYVGEEEQYVSVGCGLAQYAYLDKPTITAEGNEAIVRKDGDWVIAQDFRNQVFYSKETGEAVEIKELGQVPENLTDKPKPEGFYLWQDNDWTLDKSKQHDFIVSQNDSLEHELLIEAKEKIDILQDELDLEMSDDIEATEKSLKAWKRYRVLLNKLDVTQEDLIFPTKPE